MNIWAIIPVKPFNRAKRRLAPILSPEQRAALAEQMFRHSLEILSSVKQIGGVLVGSRGTKARCIAHDYHMRTGHANRTPALKAAPPRASPVIRVPRAHLPLG